MYEEKPKSVGVIGAGIIGLYLAWKLSEAGYKTTVFEKKGKISAKPCSGLISERIKGFIPLDPLIIQNKIDYCVIHFPKKTITLYLEPKHYVIDRHKLNEYLANLAQNSGAKILFNQPVDRIPSGFERIICCDGALSGMREALSLPKPNFKLGVQVFFPIRDSSNHVEVWPIRDGFFWKIPKGEKVEYGAMGPITSIKANFEYFLKTQNFYNPKGQIDSALIPQGLVLPKSKNITLCGDATGLTKPWSGGGVIWGLTAANILLKNFPDFEKYHKEIKKTFNFRILKGRFITSLIYLLGNNFPYLLPSKMTRDNDFPLF